MADCSSPLQVQVQEAYLAGQPITIKGGGSKFPVVEGSRYIDIREHSGIVEYDPSELVVVVRTGTRLKDLIEALAEQNQILGFEPPFANDNATVGGMVATGFSGSARPFRGGVRDFILGAKLINGKGEVVQFGGKVMKNVAGFDLFRPMAGAMGTLGVLVEVSLRLIPRPSTQEIVSIGVQDMEQAIEQFTRLSFSAATLSAAHWVDSQINLRFSGSPEAVAVDVASIGSIEKGNDEDALFTSIDQRCHPFFMKGEVIYRCDLPPASARLRLGDEQLIDWGGAQRFIKLTDSNEEELRSEVTLLGGRVSKLDANGLISPLLNVPKELHQIHQLIKASFDPAGILNPQWSV
ncbi:MAG: glycolate oxidase FAD binding subunit [Saprospiraceae bacterium]|jgi:glycolate oxidase FAD binding subunit